jgi:excisionase family DNA binding protein
MITFDHPCILVIKGASAMELLTVKETANLLRVSTVTVRRYIASGKLPAVRVGRNIRIRRDDAEGVIESSGSEVDPKYIAEEKAKYVSSDRLSSVTEDVGPTEMDEDPARYLREHYSKERQGKVPTRSKFADKSDEWLLKSHPLMKMIGFIKDEGPTDMAENHDKYLAEAYADTHEEEAVEPEVIDVDPRFADKSDEWLLENHPWMKMLGIGSDREGKSDVAENHDYYLAEAYSDMHEE